jgi:hypothetical protein
MGKEPLAKAHKQRSIIYHREKGKKNASRVKVRRRVRRRALMGYFVWGLCVLVVGRLPKSKSCGLSL